jgi:RimJ/RimL family protein N-acetyltransferase
MNKKHEFHENQGAAGSCEVGAAPNALRPFLGGDRIYLREVRPFDVNDAYYRWMNDPEVTRFLESRMFPNPIETLRDYVAAKLGDRNNVFLAIVTKEGGRHIGNIKLGPVDWVHRLGDIGLMIGEREYWGKGYATEAIRLVVDNEADGAH